MPSLNNLLDAGQLLQGFGGWALAGLALVLFIESGVLFPLLPGDSLIVTAAALHSDLNLEIWQILVVGSIAAIAGGQVGFWLGHKFGRRLFHDDARILRTDRLDAAEAFFAKYGALALVAGRFVPFIRTFIPIAAGTARMPYRHFVSWNVLGALVWLVSMTLVGTLLGGIPGIQHNIDAIIILILALSLLPMIIPAANSYLKKRRQARKLERVAEDTL